MQFGQCLLDAGAGLKLVNMRSIQFYGNTAFSKNHCWKIRQPQSNPRNLSTVYFFPSDSGFSVSESVLASSESKSPTLFSTPRIINYLFDVYLYSNVVSSQGSFIRPHGMASGHPVYKWSSLTDSVASSHAYQQKEAIKHVEESPKLFQITRRIVPEPHISSSVLVTTSAFRAYANTSRILEKIKQNMITAYGTIDTVPLQLLHTLLCNVFVKAMHLPKEMVVAYDTDRQKIAIKLKASSHQLAPIKTPLKVNNSA